jgi:hypothetical protein
MIFQCNVTAQNQTLSFVWVFSNPINLQNKDLGENIYHSERQFYCCHILHELKKVLAHTKTCWTWTRKNNLRFQTRIFFIGIFQLWGMGLPGGEYSVIPAHYSDSEPTNLCSLFLNAACLMEKQQIPIL